jgi:hypothetical protein
MQRHDPAYFIKARVPACSPDDERDTSASARRDVRENRVRDGEIYRDIYSSQRFLKLIRAPRGITRSQNERDLMAFIERARARELIHRAISK